MIQGGKYIRSALTKSWAEHCGVVLQSNPELLKNKDKFLKPHHGTKSSEIPSKLFKMFTQQVEEGKLSVKDLENIEFM